MKLKYAGWLILELLVALLLLGVLLKDCLQAEQLFAVQLRRSYKNFQLLNQQRNQQEQQLVCRVTQREKT